MSATYKDPGETGSMNADALSTVLRSVRLSSGLFFRARLRAPFGIAALTGAELRRQHLPHADYAFPFHIVTAGRLWCRVEGHAPVELKRDDIIAVPTGSPHFLSDEVERPCVRVASLHEQIEGDPPTLVHGGAGPTNEVLCGFFAMQGKVFNPLMTALPAMVVIRGTSEQASWMTSTFCKAYDQMVHRRPGSTAMIERLTEVLFLDIVQTQLQTNPSEGWLRGLGDPVVSAALSLMHAEPAYPWTVESLARRAATSRSALADRFRSRVGVSVMRYLTEWRMELAATALLEVDQSVASIAASVGYESEASFSRAFRRHAGQAPTAWRREHSTTYA